MQRQPQHDVDRRLQAHLVTGTDEDRPDMILRHQHRADALALIRNPQTVPAPLPYGTLIAQERPFRTAHSRDPRLDTDPTGEAEAPGMRDSVSIDEDQVRLQLQVSRYPAEYRHQRRPLAETEEAGDVGHGHLYIIDVRAEVHSLPPLDIHGNGGLIVNVLRVQAKEQITRLGAISGSRRRDFDTLRPLALLCGPRGVFHFSSSKKKTLKASRNLQGLSNHRQRRFVREAP